MKRKKEIEVCPNCGLRLTGKDFLVSTANILDQVAIGHNPIAGTFVCAKCNYAGSPLFVPEKNYKEIKFSGKMMRHPIQRANVRKHRALIFYGLIWLIVVFLVFWIIPDWSVKSAITPFSILALLFAIMTYYLKMYRFFLCFVISLVLSLFIPLIATLTIVVILSCALLVNISFMKEFESAV